MDEVVRDAAGRAQAADPVIEIYKRGVDRTLRENLKLTPDERVRKLARVVRFLDAVRGTARHSR